MEIRKEIETRRNAKYIPLEECKRGVVYKLYSRNLDYGVYDGKDGFIGIRTKFGDRFLFTEFHWDTIDNQPYGTAKPVEEICKLPEDTEIKTSLGCKDHKTNREVYWNEDNKKWIFQDDNTICESLSLKISIENKKLFEFLDTL